MDDLTKKHCKPCEDWMAPLTKMQYKPLLEKVNPWGVSEDKMIYKEFKFRNFKEALEFVNKVGEIAEKENHHPNIYLHNWNKVKIELTTHNIKGLSENDFILASKIDRLFLK